MDLAGTPYLLNLSLLAISFAAVSALVMLIRQTMGGKLSNFDIYLITSFVSFGFADAVAAPLPVLFGLLDVSAGALWAMAGILAALFLVVVTTFNLSRRRKAAPEPMSYPVMGSFATQGIVVIALVVNIGLHSVGLFAVALTVSLITVMIAFVRRIASLLGQTPGADWDPGRG